MKTMPLAIFVLAASVVFASPEIHVGGVSGSATHGENLTISGHSFGSKSAAPPLRWETWSGSNGGESPSSASGGWWSVHSNASVSLDNMRHSNVDRNLLLEFPSYPGGAYCNRTQESDLFYVNFWMRWQYSEQPGDIADQLKWFRFDTLDGLANAIPSIAAFHWNYYQHDSGEVVRRTDWQHRAINSACSGASSMGSLYFNMPAIENTPVWINVAAAVDQTDVENVQVQIYQSHHTGGAIVHQSKVVDFHHDCANYGELINLVKFGGSSSSGGGPVDIYYSDIYIDTSWARIEIGDYSTYSQCTHREIQIPIFWSDEIIEITVNEGAFSMGDSAYVFVVDSQGSWSIGHPIVIGSEHLPWSPGKVDFHP